jgi:hypothetical protein
MREQRMLLQRCKLYQFCCIVAIRTGEARKTPAPTTSHPAMSGLVLRRRSPRIGSDADGAYSEPTELNFLELGVRQGEAECQ